MKLNLRFYFKVVFLLMFISQGSLQAKDNDREASDQALYIVPTPSEWFSYSRFNINIIQPYKNENSQTIAYEFPEILVGQPQRVIEFNKTTATGTSWISKEGVMAECNVTASVFNCNINMHSVNQSDFSMDKAIQHLNTMGLDPQDVQGYTEVIKSFFGNEPAGILSYEI